MVLKADGEPVIQSLAKEVARVRGDAPTIPSQSKPGDSQADGTGERAVKEAEGQIRVLKMTLERRLKRKIPVNHPVSW